MPPSDGTSGVPSLSGPTFDRDPSPAYAYLREHAPVVRVPLPGDAFMWLLTRHEDAVAALADRRLSKSPDSGNPQWRRSGMGLPLDHRPSLAQHMVNSDPPDHTRLRRLVAGAFSAPRMEELRDRTRQVTDQLLDRVAPAGRADLIDDLAYPLPITIIADLLGIPDDMRDPIQGWVSVLDASGVESSPDEVRAVTDAVERFLVEVIGIKRRTPGEDMISHLVAQQREGDLSEDELTSMAFLLLVGGQEAIVALIGNALLRLLQHPVQAQQVRAASGPAADDVVAAIVEESLRLDAPFRNATWRFPVEPVTLGGQLMQPGDPILVSLLAANRDPAAFDDPDLFDPHRMSRHLAFGHGPHFCIGSALARVQGQIAIGTTLRRFPDLALRVPADELDWWNSPIMRGLVSLPVTL